MNSIQAGHLLGRRCRVPSAGQDPTAALAQAGAGPMPMPNGAPRRTPPFSPHR